MMCIGENQENILTKQFGDNVHPVLSQRAQKEFVLLCCSLTFLTWGLLRREENSSVACEAIPVKSSCPAVVIDTDIGDAIDDLWALALLATDTRVDLKLVSVCAGDQGQLDARARIVAKFLSIIGRADVSIGMGIARERVAATHVGSYFAWAEDSDLSRYRGHFLHCDAMVHRVVALAQEHEELIILAIGSPTNLAAAVQLGGDDFAKRVHVVGLYSKETEGIELGSWNADMDKDAFEVLLRAPFASFTTLSTKAAYIPWCGGLPGNPKRCSMDTAFVLGEYMSLRFNSRHAATLAVFECENLYDEQEMRHDPEGRQRRRPTSNHPSPAWDAVAAFLLLSELSFEGDAQIAPASAGLCAASRLSFCHDWVDEQKTCRRFWAWLHRNLL